MFSSPTGALTLEIILSRYILPYGGLMIAFTVHEFAHAWVTDRLGDPTPRYLKRLTLNPLNHIDPVGFLALIFFRVGWGKPVPINPYYYRHPRRDLLLTSVAGISANLALAIISTFLLYILKFLPFANLYLSQFLLYLFIYSLVLMLFNLLPLPPLDGFKAFLLIFMRHPFHLIEDRQVNLFGVLVLIALLYLGIIPSYITHGIGFFHNLLRLLGAI